jgi:uncharacterized membrane protein YoaK (UPF0700 family)
MKTILLSLMGVMALVCGIATLAVHTRSDRAAGWETEATTWTILTAASVISVAIIVASFADRRLPRQ